MCKCVSEDTSDVCPVYVDVYVGVYVQYDAALLEKVHQYL